MTDAVLVVNAGSSSVKYALYSPELACLQRGNVEGGDHEAILAEALGHIDPLGLGQRIVAAGHRVVHGGDRFAAPVRLDESVMRHLESLAPLAPLHQPHNLDAIRAVERLLPGTPQVACFDTAFHQGQPVIARMLGLPQRLHDAGVKRYGFHGLSYEHVAERLPALLGDRPRRRVIVAHLGNGASMCALLDGKSVASSMGFTALDGLVMGTRCGSLDPGVVLYLMQAKGMDGAGIERLLYRESGLLGVSGISHDMRVLLASADPRAKLAIDLFVYRAAREIGSLAAALGGLDALVFTGGIGEHAAPVREAICAASGWLGVDPDPAASRVAVVVEAADEERVIARHTWEVCASGRWPRAPDLQPPSATTRLRPDSLAR